MTTVSAPVPAGSSPPGPRPRPFVGNLLDMMRDPPGFYIEMARQYGDVVRFKLGKQAVYFLNHPDLIRDVLATHQKKFSKGRTLEAAKRVLGEGLLTAEGEFHLQQRRMIQPAFHRDQIARYAGVMTDHAVRRAERWPDGEKINIADEMMQLTLSIIAKTLFSADVEKEAPEVGSALHDVMVMGKRLTIPFYEKLEALPFPTHVKYRRGKAFLDATIQRIIDDRRKGHIDPHDLLSVLISARDVEGDGRRMTDEQVRDELMTLFLAGHETTANGLAWAFYLLTQHPDCERKLRAEIETVVGQGTPNLETLARLPYTRCFITEVLRHYPPVWNIARRVNEPFQAGAWEIPVGAIVIVSPYAMHHDGRFFEDPFRFDPDRWIDESENKKRPRYSYFPFSGGPRICVAEQFALLEMTLLLVSVLQRWRFKLVGPAEVPYQALVTLRPRNGVWVIPTAVGAS